ncbi:hypothetical protein E2C01_054228 [Portunus trituberculatus]|uniref:Uncharacterized protein n=1 Tax=Portunus trituberculatus TaxID=210409 RepID=A0A5B7GIR7_PORTR|nr:hypothetical protein [Portunus trituberculatus]
MDVEEVARRWSSMARLRGMLGCVSPITEIPGAPSTTHLGNPGRVRGLSRSRSYECTDQKGSVSSHSSDIIVAPFILICVDMNNKN